jgi:tetratricopeptide (TPR) repeat protein
MRILVISVILMLATAFSSCNNPKETKKNPETKAPATQDTAGMWLGNTPSKEKKIINSAEIQGAVDLSQIRNGIAAAQQGDYESALEDFNNAVNEDPSNAHFLYYRAETYLNLKQFDKAWDDIHAIERINPDLKDFHALKGRYHTAVGQHTDAYHEYRIALETNSEDAILWDAKGASAMNIMKLPEAMEAFDKALELDPELASAYYNRGLLFANNQDFQKAIDDLSISINLDDDNPEAYINRGNAYFMMKNYMMAEENYAKAVELDPQNWLAYNGMGSVNKANGNNMQAIVYYTKAIEINPDAANAIYNRGLAKYANGDRAGACTDWNRAKALGVTPAQKWLDMYCK